MADHRSIAGALPWYAAQTLDEGERREIEEHLLTCGDCRDRLAQIRDFAELGATVPTERALEHVAPGLLVEYAENPDGLDEETVLWIEGRLAACATCRDAYRNLQQSDLEPAAVLPQARVDAGRGTIGLWNWLAGTLLRPAPALAYLLIAAIGLPLLWVVRTPGDPAAAVRIVAVNGERTQRNQQSTIEPLTIDVQETRPPLILELITDLAEDDLRPGAMQFDVELSLDGRPIWTAGRDPSEFALREGRAVLQVILDPAALDLRVDYRVTIRARKPGDPLDGQALFVRKIRLRGK